LAVVTYRAAAHTGRGEWAAGERLLREAEAMGERLGKAATGRGAYSLCTTRAGIERARGCFAEAEVALQKALGYAEGVTGHEAASRQHALLFLSEVRALQGKYAAAADAAGRYRRAALAGKPPSADAVFFMAQYAALLFTVGDPDRAIAVIDELSRQRADDPAHLGLLLLSWGAGGAAGSPGHRVAELADRVTALSERARWTRGAAWGVATYHLRRGDPEAAGRVMEPTTKARDPIDHLVLGLIAARRGDRAEGRRRLAQADALIPVPTAENPFPYAKMYLLPLETRLLREELERELNPRLAPPPRAVDPNP
jgi:hypothetical protein